ncbi:glycosyl hydrolase family 28-related protein [Daejeonella sp. JGW-45]|uniref:glycosyl hydrolase family 28-related protein n=1 Tax=Daejeonella sp. JGW-45 TaxID=3034148 RepID=UPI0023EC28C0|nr:glycosyl hydrolase family 28-related protein [Daejeonella sp. JGW-45]
MVVGVCPSSFGLPTVSVKTFGALGDDNIDDTEAIQKAIDYTASISGILYFPNGHYIVSKLSIKCSLLGSDKSVIVKSLNAFDQEYEFCRVDRQSYISISKITFNGSGGISNSKVTGSIPLFISYSRNIHVSECKFENSPMSGIRVESSQNINIHRSVASNSIGNFGDGFYIEDCVQVNVSDCRANEYTRIGFVVERNSYDIQFENCTASNGRNASSLRGGGEYNAGFWFEGSGDITVKNCKAINNTHFGFVATSGIDKKLKPGTVNFTYKNCSSTNSAIGFRVSSSGNPVKITLNECKSEKVNQGFIALARDESDIFEFLRCTVGLITSNSTGLNDMGFMWESSINEKGTAGSLPVFKFIKSRVNYVLPIAISKLYSRDINNSDIGTYGGGAANIFIEDFSNSLGKTGVIIKAIRGQPSFYIKNTKANLNYLVKKENVKIL